MNRIEKQIEAIIRNPQALLSFLKELPAERRAVALQPLQDALLAESSTRDAIQQDLEIMARTDISVADICARAKARRTAA